MSTTLTTRDLTEYVQSSASQVDADAGVIRGVRILNPVSRNGPNGRRYTPQAIREALGHYEGAKVNFDHPPGERAGMERSVRDRGGRLENVREHEGGLAGDLHVLKSHPYGPAVLEAAERMPDVFGLSHNVQAKVRDERGVEVIESIARVRSVDIVSDPATTRGLFESVSPTEPEGDSPMGWKKKPRTVAQVLEAFPADRDARALVTLLEEELPAAAAEAPVDVPAEADSAAQIKAAFRAAIVAAFDDESLDMKATLGRIKEVLTSYEKLTAKKADKPAGDGDGAVESLRRQVDELGDSVLESVKQLTARIEQLGAEVTKPQSHRRQESEEFEPPKDTRDFVRQITE